MRLQTSMQQESIEFMTLLAARSRPQTTNLLPFNQKHWFQGAYRTIQRNVPKHLFTAEAKQQCEERIFHALPFLTLENFDVSMNRLIGEISDDFPITIGQSQKLVNILLKYHACLFHSGAAPEWNQLNPWVAAISPVQHVPIDSIVLFGLCRNDPAGSAGFVTASSRFDYNKASSRFVWSHAASVYVPDSPEGNGSSVPWSGIKDYAVYFRLQTMIRTLAAQKEIAPLLYEMRHLWAPA